MIACDVDMHAARLTRAWSPAAAAAGGGGGGDADDEDARIRRTS